MSRIPLFAMIAAILAAGCADSGTAADADPADADPMVHVHLTNAGATPLRCRIMFGHWVNRDLGILAPGAETRFDMQQSPKDGALYIMRDDGQRRMMIENLFCARDGGPQATEGQVDLAPARSGRPREIVAACAMPANGGRVECPPAILKP